MRRLILTVAIVAALLAGWGSWGTRVAGAAAGGPGRAFLAFIHAGNRDDLNAFCRGFDLKAVPSTVGQCAQYWHAKGGAPVAKHVTVDHTSLYGKTALLRVTLDKNHFRFEMRLKDGRWLVHTWKCLDCAGITVGGGS